MLSVQPPVIPQRTRIPMHVEEQSPSKTIEFRELGDVEDAVEPFARLIDRSGSSVRLYCTVPTTIPSSEHFIDAQDMHDLRTRSLVFVHNLVEALRSRNIPASYRLQPSSCPLCVVCALPPHADGSKVKAAALEAVENAHLQLSKKALLAHIEDGLALIIT